MNPDVLPCICNNSGHIMRLYSTAPQWKIKIDTNVNRNFKSMTSVLSQGPHLRKEAARPAPIEEFYFQDNLRC